MQTHDERSLSQRLVFTPLEVLIQALDLTNFDPCAMNLARNYSESHGSKTFFTQKYAV